MKNRNFPIYYVFLILFSSINLVISGDITSIAFPDNYDGVIAAYGDFNSDEFTDIFVLRDNFRTIEILLAHDSPPLLHRDKLFRCHYPNLEITSVVPGDFDGDALMDVMFTAKSKDHKGNELDVYINYGGLTHLNCSKNDSTPVIANLIGEPLALDYMNDMVIDLFGVRLVDGVEKRTLWVFDKSRSPPHVEDLDEDVGDNKLGKLTKPHSHATIDMNDDGLADLVLSTEKGFEVWLAHKKSKKFHFDHNINFDFVGPYAYLGQAVYADTELNGNLTQIVPVCFDADCKDSKIYVHSYNHFRQLDVNFYQDDDNKTQWGFLTPKEHGKFFEKAMTLRMGDFNNDGYVDLLATLQRKDKSDSIIQTFLLENVKNPNPRESDKIKRTFAVRWNALTPLSDAAIMGSFYDFYQDGILDVIMVQKVKDSYKPVAFRNTLDYDANFVKVIVLTGLENALKPPKENSPFSSSKSKSYGSNLPGPKIKYHTTTQEGLAKHGASTQLAQSAHFSLHLPYQIFGLGRTPNFIDNVEIFYAGKSKTWPQIIPNSQMLVIPKNPEQPSTWKAQLFVTPSKIIIQSIIALLGICLIISIIILGLHLKERREDKLEKLQEAQRFHFDAM